MVSEGRANQLGAYSRYKGMEMQVSGVVVATGMRGVERIEARPAFGRYEIARQTDQHPWVELRDPNDSTGNARLVCFFDPSKLDEVASLSPGMPVTVTGKFQEFIQASGMAVMLHSCRLP